MVSRQKPRTGTPNMRTGSLNTLGKHNFAARTGKTAHWQKKTAPRLNFTPHWLKKTAHWQVEHAHWQKKPRTGTPNMRTGSLNKVGKHNFTALARRNSALATNFAGTCRLPGSDANPQLDRILN